MIAVRVGAALDQLDRVRFSLYNKDAMGEVPVKAKLTNAVDEALVRRGMLKPVPRIPINRFPKSNEIH